jgi:WD40 repeat protein
MILENNKYAILALENLNNDLFASCGVDDCISIWNWNSGNKIVTLKGESYSPCSLLFCKEKRILVIFFISMLKH